MKYYLRLGIVLLVIAIVSSGILAYINSFTRPIIEENQKRAKAEARKEVLPVATDFDSISFFNDETVYVGVDSIGNQVGYTFVASLYGYSSLVKTMVGLTPELKINKIKIIEQKETPGLGANSEKTEFQEQFSGKNIKELTVDKDGGNIISITGATITTRTVTNSIRSGIEMMTELTGFGIQEDKQEEQE